METTVFQSKLKAIEKNLVANGYRVYRGVEELLITPIKGYAHAKKVKEYFQKLAFSYQLVGHEASEEDRAGIKIYIIG